MSFDKMREELVGLPPRERLLALSNFLSQMELQSLSFQDLLASAADELGKKSYELPPVPLWLEKITVQRVSSLFDRQFGTLCVDIIRYCISFEDTASLRCSIDQGSILSGSRWGASVNWNNLNPKLSLFIEKTPLKLPSCKIYYYINGDLKDVFFNIFEFGQIFEKHVKEISASFPT